MSPVLVIELLFYAIFAAIIIIDWHDRHSWIMPVLPMITLWQDLENNHVNLAGKIIAQILASVFTLRFALTGYILLIIYHIWHFLSKGFMKIFKKHN